MVELPSLRSRVVQDSAITPLHLAATCAIPCAFPPVKIDGIHYVDGGLRSGLPIWVAEQLGATRVVALNVLNTPGFRVLHSVMWGHRPTPGLEVTLLEPSRRLGSLRDAIRWNPDLIKRWIAQGEEDATRIATSVTM
jgi:NTE family protein